MSITSDEQSPVSAAGGESTTLRAGRAGAGYKMSKLMLLTWPGAWAAIMVVLFLTSHQNPLGFLAIWACTAVAGSLIFVGLTWQVARLLVVSASGMTGRRWRGKRIDLSWDQVTTFLPAADMKSGMRSPPAFEIHRGGGNLLLDFDGGETASLLAVLRYMPMDHPARPAVEAATRKP